MRSAVIERNTKETKISMSLNLDGSGKYEIHTGIGFFDHMLEALFKQTMFDVTIKAEGDLQVDDHHTVEDVGIVIGKCLKEALGDCRGIVRYGYFLLPMDEALVLSAIDISGRGHLSYDIPMNASRVGTFDTELCREFFEGLSRNADLTLHLKKLDGANTHHILEAAFKSFGRSIHMACSIDEKRKDQIPSTKGVL